MAKFEGRRGDSTWGTYDYPVTLTQKKSLEGIWYMLSGLPKATGNLNGLPAEGFYSQDPGNGDVIIGLFHHSVYVHRDGRITSAEEERRVRRVKIDA